MRKKIIIVTAIAAAVFAAVGLVLHAVIMSYPHQMLEYESSKRWGAEAHSHITAYMTTDNGFDAYSVMKAKNDIESAYTTDSIETNKVLYSASLESRISLSSLDGLRRSNCTATVYSGDYFKFRNIPLTEGTYPTDSETVSDAILIDELAAWQLFGTHTGVTGMEICLGNNIYVVSGVTKALGGIYKEVYGEYPRVYLRSDSASLRRTDNVFTVFEAMLPDPITNYAENTMKTALQSYDPIIRNIDKRFGGESLDAMNKTADKLIIDSSKTEYPFTEKAMLLLTLDAAKVYSAKVVMYYISAICLLVLFFAVYSPIVKFIERQIGKLKF